MLKISSVAWVMAWVDSLSIFLLCFQKVCKSRVHHFPDTMIIVPRTATTKKGQRKDIIELFIDYHRKYIVSILLMLSIHSQVLSLAHPLLECQLTLKLGCTPAATTHCSHCSHDAATYVIECYRTSFTLTTNPMH